MSLLDLPPELAHRVLNDLDACNLERVANACTVYRMHTDTWLRSQNADMYPAHAPLGFSSLAAYLAWVKWITLKLGSASSVERDTAVLNFRRFVPSVLAEQIGRVLPKLADSSSSVRRHVVEILGKLAPTELEHYVDDIVGMLDDEDDVRDAALIALGTLAPIALVPYTDAIADSIGSGDSMCRTALYLMGKLDSVQLVPYTLTILTAVLDMLNSPESDDDEMGMANAIGKLLPAEILVHTDPIIYMITGSGRPDERARKVNGLVHMMLHGTNADARRVAMYILGIVRPF